MRPTGAKTTRGCCHAGGGGRCPLSNNDAIGHLEEESIAKDDDSAPKEEAKSGDNNALFNAMAEFWNQNQKEGSDPPVISAQPTTESGTMLSSILARTDTTSGDGKGTEGSAAATAPAAVDHSKLTSCIWFGSGSLHASATRAPDSTL